MSGQQNGRLGVAVGLAALTGMTVAGFGAFGVAARTDAAVQRHDVALMNSDVMANAVTVVGQQADLLSSQFNVDTASQAGYYFWVESWAGKDLANWLLNVGNVSDPYWSVYNGAPTRFDEAALVGQGIQQAQFDHANGLNAVLGGPSGTDFCNLYEAQIGSVLYNAIEGSGVSPTPAVGQALAALQTAYTDPVGTGTDAHISASGFLHAMQNLQTALSNNGLADLFGNGAGRVPPAADPDASAHDAAALTGNAVVAEGDAVIAVEQQAQLLSNQFTNDVASQAGYYFWVESWAGKGLANWLLNVGSTADPYFSIYNGATTRFDEAALVAQGIQQAQWDHMVNVNATLGGPSGTDFTNLYEYQLGSALYNAIIGSAPTGKVHDALAALQTAYTDPIGTGADAHISASGFLTAMQNLENALSNNAWADLLSPGAGMGAAEAGAGAADAVGAAASGVDLPL